MDVFDLHANVIKDYADYTRSFIQISDERIGELTTIYVKYAAPETGDQPYVVVWVKKSTSLILGLSLPGNVCHERLVEAPKGCKYAGLTKYLVVDAESPVPSEFSGWVQSAFAERRRIAEQMS